MGVVFITGAMKNTGLEIAEKFAKEGFEVAISSRDAEGIKNTATEISKKYGVCAKGYFLEVSSVESIKNVFAQIKNDFGRLDTSWQMRQFFNLRLLCLISVYTKLC